MSNPRIDPRQGHLHQLKLPKLKPSKLKIKVVKAKQVLKNTQDTIRKALEEKKKVWEVVKNVKASARELGVYN